MIRRRDLRPSKVGDAHTLRLDGRGTRLRYPVFDSASAAKPFRFGDVGAKNPNLALREYWTSTQAFRTIVHKAAQMFGTDAEPLLTEIEGPDVHVLATIHLAQGLAGRDRGVMSVMVQHTGH